MPQLARYPVPLDCRTDGFGDDQPDARTRNVAVTRTLNMNDDVGLYGTRPVLHRLAELG